MKSSEKKKKEIKTKEDILCLPKEEQLKYEIAEELGVLDRVLNAGWGALSSSENGKIGGIVAHKNKQ